MRRDRSKRYCKHCGAHDILNTTYYAVHHNRLCVLSSPGDTVGSGLTGPSNPAAGLDSLAAGDIPDGTAREQVQSGAPDLQDDNCSDDSDYLSASSTDVDSLCASEDLDGDFDIQDHFGPNPQADDMMRELEQEEVDGPWTEPRVCSARWFAPRKDQAIYEGATLTVRQGSFLFLDLKRKCRIRDVALDMLMRVLADVVLPQRNILPFCTWWRERYRAALQTAFATMPVQMMTLYGRI
ncbi:TPA: hypothetical protein ACH3X1_011781 [Trebouxia sp. C0004]